MTASLSVFSLRRLNESWHALGYFAYVSGRRGSALHTGLLLSIVGLSSLFAGNSYADQTVDIVDVQKCEEAANETNLRKCLKNLTGKANNTDAQAVYDTTSKKNESGKDETQNTSSLVRAKGTSLDEEWAPTKSPLAIYKQNYILFTQTNQPNNTPDSPNPLNKVPFTYPLGHHCCPVKRDM